MEQPLVSVITVTYNSAPYVRDTIESVLSQTYSAIEYIIADDCSKDKTWSIIQEYTDPRIRACRNEVNIGEYPNRNKAIGLAKGKYLLFIDGDDVIYSHGVAFFVSMMEAFPQAGFAVQKGYENNVLFPALMQPEETLRNYFYSKKSLLTSSFASNFFKTAILKEQGLKTNYITGDEEVRLRIAASYPVLFVAGWVSWPRETPGQASLKLRDGSGLVETFRFSKDILTERSNDLGLALTEDMIGIMQKKIVLYALLLLRKGKVQSAIKFLAKAGVEKRSIVQYFNYQPAYRDVLADYTPASPFRNGFLVK
jgi:glycosyltransferase involved in cell wall biosynthesis